MPMPEDRWEQLAEESNWYGEQAARAYLDGFLEPALEAASRAVHAQRQLHDDDPANRDVAEVFAEGLRNRAEIQCGLALLPTAARISSDRRWSPGQTATRTGAAGLKSGCRGWASGA